ncbi:MAG: UDP-N-acetylmuramoyl-tripeptide--D-alanyl-D-alanine ligase [Bacteroidales bacterium]|jgi:UDP-N-acetylmuramoyl-tripeptide--D-alanyl-D-alanine ligase|nr:UDP-N-acetylmuramoyl-tripeptide--D-alanyl-D-alanine ligase [Bacteroidales bacterium]
MISVNEVYNIFLQSTGVNTDTKTVMHGNIFFGLKGNRYNGNSFAGEALEKGASFAVIDEPKYKINEQCLLVDNVLSTLQQLANHHRNQLNIPVIGITGTNGKTTTKELINHVLSTKYKVYATEGNLNNHIGVPLTLLKINKKDAQIAIIEMGANHVGEIKELCQIAEPNYGIITNIGKAHLEGFGSVDRIIETKSALYQSVKANHGTVFVNSGDKLLMEFSSDIKRITYGQLSGNCKGICQENNLLIKIILPDHSVEIQTQLAGDYNFYNIMGAITVGLYFSIPIDDIKFALEKYIPNNRSQLIKKNNKFIIIDAYNANPSSMELAICNLAKIQTSPKSLLLGDMFELGESSVKEHQRIVDLIRKYSFDTVYLLGEAFAKTNADTSWVYTNAEQLSIALKKTLPENTTLLIKGSRAMKMELFLNII